MTESPFKTLNGSVRPTRVAILVDRADDDWQNTCLRIIEFYSRLWGGAHNIIIPTDGTQIDERFWKLLEAFDPDYLYRYCKSVEDIHLGAPERYQEILEKEVQNNIEQGGALTAEAAAKQIDKRLRKAWLRTQFDITAELHGQIKKRIAPFWFDHWVVNAGAITAESDPPWPLTRIAKILSNTEHHTGVAAIEMPTNLLPTLWFASVTGQLSPEGFTEFEQVDVTREAFPFTEENVSQLIEFTISGTTRGSRTGSANSTLIDLGEAAPFNISMLQLGLYRSLKYQAWREPVLIIAGNAFEDFCLFYCLARVRNGVVWVLPSVTEKALSPNPGAALSAAEMSFVFQVRDAERSSQSEGGLACLSYSLSSAQIDAVIQQLNRHGAGQFSNPITQVNELESLIRFPLVAVERDNFQRDLVIQFEHGRSISPFATPKPKHFDPIHPSEHRYIAQLSIVGDAPPKHANLGLYIICAPQYTTEQARVGKDGPAYLCPNIGYFGGDIDTVLVRPRLYLPSLHKILEHLAAKQGYECRPSDKGIYADESISKWGGLEQIGEFLRNGRHRALLDNFLDDSKSAIGKGVYLSDKRRYLDFAAIKSHVGDSAIDLLDELVAKEIIYRGFIFGCSYCRNADWFSVSDITQEFKCRRCGRTQPYSKRNWKTGEEPGWFYKLDELVYQGYRQNMDVSLLALNYLKTQSQDSFTFTTDREFWRSGATKPDVEADLFCVPDGMLTVGEAKIDNSLADSAHDEREKINKYKRIASSLSARRLVFATLSDEWRPETVAAIQNSFRDLPYVQLTFLSAAQLL
jgi:hypothetical protein